MKLYYHSTSSNCREVLVVCGLLGIDLDLQSVDLPTGEHKKPPYLKINPNGLVPTLEDGSLRLWESNAIAQYLANTNPAGKIWSSDKRVRSEINCWQFWEQAHWNPPIVGLFYQNFLNKQFYEQDPDPKEVAKGEEAFHHVARVLDEHLEDRKYLAGDGLTLADISVISILTYAQQARLPLAPYQNIKRWYGDIEKLEPWQRTAPSWALDV